MTVLAMSRKESNRMAVLRDLADKRLKVSEAAIQLRLCPRQVLRLAHQMVTFLNCGKWDFSILREPALQVNGGSI